MFGQCKAAIEVSPQNVSICLQSSRQELIQDVDELKKKITGAAEE